ncbi:hypothetical protein D3C76_587350 [compost metagenome]
MRRPPQKWPTAGASHERAQRGFGLVHRPPDRYLAADLRSGDAGGHRLPPPAGGTAARGRLPDHSGHCPVARGQPGNHGLVGGHAAGGAVQCHPRHDPDDQQQCAGLDQPDPAVHPRQEHRHRRPGSAGGHQHRHRALAARPAQPADLAQGQPGRQPGAGADGQLQPDAWQRPQRLRRNPARAPAEPDRRGRPDQHHRATAPGDPRAGATRETGRHRPDPGRPAPGHPADQPEPGQGCAVRRTQRVDHRRQRPVVPPRRLRPADRLLP